MNKHNPKNGRIKRRYLAYLEDARRMSPKSTDQVAAAIALFEASTGYKDFARFHIEQARSFKRRLNNSDTGKILAKATIHSRLMALKAFFMMSKLQTGQAGVTDLFLLHGTASRPHRKSTSGQCCADRATGSV